MLVHLWPCGTHWCCWTQWLTESLSVVLGFRAVQCAQLPSQLALLSGAGWETAREPGKEVEAPAVWVSEHSASFCPVQDCLIKRVSSFILECASLDAWRCSNLLAAMKAMAKDWNYKVGSFMSSSSSYSSLYWPLSEFSVMQETQSLIWLSLGG